jgi:hypothetical protein
MGKIHKDKEYKVFSVRLEDEVIEELQKNRANFKSWNLLFRHFFIEKKQKKLL